MKIDAKLFNKYGAHSVILPPPSENTFDFDIPNHIIPTIEDPDMDFLDALEALKIKNRNKKSTKPVIENDMRPQDSVTVPFTTKEAALYIKYAVMLPPSMDNTLSLESLPSFKDQKISPFLSQFVLEEGDDALDPSIFEDFEPEVTKHRRNDMISSQLLEDLRTNQEELDDSYKQNKSDEDAPTVPPPRKKANLSIDRLITLCSKYYDLVQKKTNS